MSAAVLVVGEGVLAEQVCRELSGQCQVIHQTDWKQGVPKAVQMALVLHDTWLPSIHHEAEEVTRAAGIPWLRGFLSFGEAIIGPLVRPDTIGCSLCADSRRLMAGRDRKEMWALQQQWAEQAASPRDVWASQTGLLQVAHVVVAEVQRALQGGNSQLEGHVYLVNLKTLKSSRHHFLPDPQCPVCGHLPEDSPEAAQITLKPSPKISRNSYRCRSMEELQGVLIKEYLDYRIGFLNGKMHDLVSPFATVSVNLPLFDGDEATAGRTHSYAESELTAILEGLERYCGLTARGKRTTVHGSYKKLKKQALNPVTVGVHARKEYARRDFPFQPFDPNRSIDWVWGYSFLQERPILVPELFAYYSLGCEGDGFVYETSNGCAMGGSLEEAIFYGILEVVERDSFLMTWYAQLPLPRLDPSSAHDPELSMMIERIRMVAGYDVYLYNSTMENGIPSIWALAKNRKPTGVHVICAAGAHLDPVRAAKSAIQELAGMMLTQDEKAESNKAEYERMFRDPYHVRFMEDHSMLYSLPQAEERFHFLLDEQRPLRAFDEEFPARLWHEDLTDDLKDLLQVFRQLQLDVIVVDQTTPEMQRNGLACVKVLIPGMLPMTFGYHLTRLTGLERVLKVPMELGYAKRPLTLEQLNPHPHPFP